MAFLYANRSLRLALGTWCFYLLLLPALVRAQAGYELDLKKPAKYENKTLGSEKTQTTKNTYFRRFVQGTITHYNYYFNANQKLIAVLNDARGSQKDDLTALIPFYDYSLKSTKADSKELDSVIYKCTAGIVLHDLRNGWIDNLYLLIGQAYFFETKFDSADHILEFLNYHFYVKEEGDYHIPIGTRGQAQAGQISIVNPENHSILHEAFNRPPSRNDGLIWQIRSYTEQSKYAQAAGLISLLRTDPIFPDRLKPALAEEEAYWFYRQENWDSTVVYLQQALPNAYNIQSRARWEYLLAQLNERIRQPATAVDWYSKAIVHTTDPRVDIYAHLYRALLTHGSSKDAIPNTIAALLGLAKKDRFAPFRDILYLSAAKLALEEPDTALAYTFLYQSVRSQGKGEVKNQAFLVIADLGKTQGNYKTVALAYDSIQLGDPALKPRAAELTSDKAMYDKVLSSILTIEREDSLQRIAALPDPQRLAYVKDLLRKLLRAQGLKDDYSSMGYAGALAKDSLGGNLFGNNTGTGEWYFYNQTTLSQGSQDFQNRWGSRPNVDNWRRQSAIVNTVAGVIRPTTEEGAAGGKSAAKVQELSIKGLMAGLPLTPPTLEASNDTVAANLYILGNLYKNEVGDNQAAVKVLEELYRRYPTYKEESTLFNLYYCWHKVGDEVKANYYLDLLHKRYPGGKFETSLSAPSKPVRDTLETIATDKYKEVYDQFIAGNYDSALLIKKEADSVFGNKYWTPQLMYIQAVYYAHERQDTLALRTLNGLIAQFPKDPLTPRAVKLKDVINRRPQIEQYLTNLKVERDKENALDSSLAVKAPPPAPPDRTGLHTQRLDRIKSPLEIRPDASVFTVPGKNMQIRTNAPQGLHSDSYVFDPSSPHVVMMVMTQVSYVFANEAKNAFARYNQDAHYNDNIPTDTIQLVPGVTILRFGPFANIVDALTYEVDLQKNSGRDIVPWLAKDKYQFLVISEDNLAVLRQKKDLAAYSTFIASYLKNLTPVK
jgi:outer membrane protein assembly factor BamD (BamD/ComL family)